MPLTGFFVALLFFKETKKSVIAGKIDSNSLNNAPINMNSKRINVVNNDKKLPVESSVMLLVLNGFLLMYAFATETIYAMFMKDSFGYGERALSTLFAFNGFFIGVFQVFFIKPMINMIGKHATLAVGNALLAMGMVGVALVRKETLHFMLFAGHIIGYSVADTALASLISR
jgi:Na+/melibiose symporter-like transporter